MGSPRPTFRPVFAPTVSLSFSRLFLRGQRRSRSKRYPRKSNPPVLASTSRVFRGSSREADRCGDKRSARCNVRRLSPSSPAPRSKPRRPPVGGACLREGGGTTPRNRPRTEPSRTPVPPSDDPAGSGRCCSVAEGVLTPHAQPKHVALSSKVPFINWFQQRAQRRLDHPACLRLRKAASASRNVSTTLIQPGSEFKLDSSASIERFSSGQDGWSFVLAPAG